MGERWQARCRVVLVAEVVCGGFGFGREKEVRGGIGLWFDRGLTWAVVWAGQKERVGLGC